MMNKLQEKGTMKKLEIGCGGRPTDGYLHQDVTVVDGVDLDYQCAPFEIPDKDFDLIIAIGVMEHLRFSEFEKTVKHFLSILNIEKSFLFDVPDLKTWCQYYIDSCDGKPVPFEHFHILNTIYGWQRWKGDEHKSGWSQNALKELIDSIQIDNTCFEIEVCNPDIFKELGINRNRFDRVHDAHLYVKLTKKQVK